MEFRAQQELINPYNRGRYKNYTAQQKTDCVIWYIELGRPTEVQRRYRAKYGKNEIAPNERNIKRWFEQFQQRGSVFRKERVSPRPARTTVNIQTVLEYFSAFEHSSLQRAENALEISKTSIFRILKDERWHPYKIQLIQELLPEDLIARRAFVEQHLAFLAADPEHLKRIWWTDEANFHVNGAVNKYNCRYWSPTNPLYHAEKPLHSPKVCVWVGMNANGIVGPYFFNGNVNATNYIQMLEDFFIPEMQNRPDFDTMLFQQDGAPAHYANRTKDLLNDVFPGRWIGRGSPNLSWPARSPDLTVPDFFGWGYVKSKVYAVPIRDIEHLKERIIEAFLDLPPAMVRRACLDGVERRFRKCLELNGRSVELPDPPRQVPPQQAAPEAPNPPPRNSSNVRRRRISPVENVEPVPRRRGRPSNTLHLDSERDAEFQENVEPVIEQVDQAATPPRSYCTIM